MSSPPKGCQTGEPLTQRGIAKSKATRWRIWVLIGVHVAFAIHIGMWLANKKTISPIEPSEAQEFGRSAAINAGFVFFVLMILSTLVLGRFFCGWACHLVALQDLCAGIMKRMGITPRPLRSRLLALVPFIAGFYLFLWPLVLRWYQGTIDHPVTIELETTAFWATFPGLVITILTLLVSGFAAVYFLGSKGFCTYACPYGAFFHAADRVAPLRIRVNDDCEGCGHCTAACTSNVAVAVEVRKYGMVVDPGCMKCLDCVSVCPKDALSVSWGKPAIAVRGKTKRKPRYSLGMELLLAFGFLAGFFTFRGLYGRVPFLMTLAVAGCCAFFLLRAFQLWRKERVEIPPFVLKRGGRITRAGWGWCAFLLAFFVFWGHSAYVRYHDWRSQQIYQPLIPVRDAWFTAARPEVTPEIKQHAERVIEQASMVIDQGLWETPRTRVERGWAHMILGDQEGFMADLEVASRLAKKDINTLVERGHALRTQQRSGEALPLYREALRRDPDQAITQRYLIDAAKESERLPEAVEALEKIARERRWDAVVRESLALAYALSGESNEAEAVLKEALELAPPGEGPWRRLLEYYMANRRAPDALLMLRQEIERSPKDGDMRAAYVNVLLAENRHDEALKALQAGLEQAPQNETLLKLQQSLQPK